MEIVEVRNSIKVWDSSLCSEWHCRGTKSGDFL